MSNSVKDQLQALNDERLGIERRIDVRSALHAAKWLTRTLWPVGRVMVMGSRGTYHALTLDEWTDATSHDPTEDAVRYVQIEDQCWELLGMRDETGRNESVPE